MTKVPSPPPLCGGLHVICVFTGHVNKRESILPSLLLLLLHVVPHGAALPLPTDCLYLAVGARVKGRAHSMLRKCFIYGYFDRELCFHVMNEHLFFFFFLVWFFDISVLKSIWKTVLLGQLW